VPPVPELVLLGQEIFARFSRSGCLAAVEYCHLNIPFEGVEPLKDGSMARVVEHSPRTWTRSGAGLFWRKTLVWRPERGYYPARKKIC